MTAGRKPKLDRALSDAKTAVTQALVYAQDKGLYPTSLKVLRDQGYANVADTDPWHNGYVLSPMLSRGTTPRKGDDVYVYSKGEKGMGKYPQPFTSKTGKGGAVGYSSIYGPFRPDWSTTRSWSLTRRSRNQTGQALQGDVVDLRDFPTWPPSPSGLPPMSHEPCRDAPCHGHIGAKNNFRAEGARWVGESFRPGLNA